MARHASAYTINIRCPDRSRGGGGGNSCPSKGLWLGRERKRKKTKSRAPQKDGGGETGDTAPQSAAVICHLLPADGVLTPLGGVLSCERGSPSLVFHTRGPIERAMQLALHWRLSKRRAGRLSKPARAREQGGERGTNAVLLPARLPARLPGCLPACQAAYLSTYRSASGKRSMKKGDSQKASMRAEVRKTRERRPFFLPFDFAPIFIAMTRGKKIPEFITLRCLFLLFLLWQLAA